MLRDRAIASTARFGDGGYGARMSVPATPARLRPHLWAAALAGALAGGAAIAVSELVAGVTGAPSLVAAIGELVIDLQPPGAKELMVSLFDTSDKLALNVLVVAAAIAIAALAGVIASRWFMVGAGIFVAFGVLAAVAAARSPLVSTTFAVLNAFVAVAAALGVLGLLFSRMWPRTVARRAPASAVSRGAGTAAAGDTPPVGVEAAPSPDWPRRRFLVTSAATLGGIVVAGAVGRTLVDARHPEGIVTTSKPPGVPGASGTAGSSGAVTGLPTPAAAVPPLMPAASLDVPGITPLVIPAADFYKIDTTLLVPQVDLASWTLKVTGMVEHPLTFTYDELLAMPLFEQYVTIACVSDRVGDDLVGNALWTGVRLKDVLQAAGVQAGATQVVGRSVDGFTAGFPTSWAMAPEREPMIVVGMDRDLLPAAHGFPARLIVPGLYGYVSATKWLSEIQLTTREAVDGYWVPLGWAKDGPILTQSRIDVPETGARLAAGPVAIAGIAFAPDRGISGVEVRIDGGDWQKATISEPISKATWVQWTLPWTAAAGHHQIEVRAIDGTGTAQTDQKTDPAPDGARGHHVVRVDVS
jgi:DMSO/TMAO reductase YedYZ molybdopterin-dependent catalytic subunit